MLFKDRVDAGKQLASRLTHYADAPDTLVIGLPRGGVVPAYEVAHALHVPLDIVVPRKIGAPDQPELAVGALTEDGIVMLDEKTMLLLDLKQSDLEHIIEVEKKEAQRRLTKYRAGKGERDFKNKTIIVVDDGIATGATMRAALASVRAHGVKKIVVAVPVAPKDSVDEIVQQADEFICLVTPDYFPGVGYFYQTFGQTTDDEVIALLAK